jgi:hypothetical protein
MSALIPAIDEDVGVEGSFQYDLEFRRKGQKHWNLGGGGPLNFRRGKFSRRIVEKAKLITIEDETEYLPNGKVRVPELEFRIVQKEFVVKRALISERSLS